MSEFAPSLYPVFIFDSYSFDSATGEARFHYRSGDHRFTEIIKFALDPNHSLIPDREHLLSRALELCHLLIGTSYYKCFPTSVVQYPYLFNDNQLQFFNSVYQEGLSQFAYENNLTRSDLAHFTNSDNINPENDPISYSGQGALVLQSGGKDSLLTASLLTASGINFTPWYVTSSDHHPEILDQLGQSLVTTLRQIDHENLKKAAEQGALNGHVPVTYIIQSLAIVQAILLNKSQILVSIGNEGAEPHAYIDDLPVNHQWSKTWEAEQTFANYVHTYISPDLQIGSPLRQFSELKIAELFVRHAWDQFGHQFSSCNIANYRQNSDNTTLKWCAKCPKCANSYLLFTPFLSAAELKPLFSNQDLFADPELIDTFKGLLGIDHHIKPFECIAEIAELRTAYQMIDHSQYAELPFAVPPETQYNYHHKFDAQSWATDIINSELTKQIN
ncbi:hypothetical protein FWD07_00785 [Candidatus Saccharibacteria bacterium]|nr:hypothetical protein [Candidatus Saccharibacteria bacterium]